MFFKKTPAMEVDVIAIIKVDHGYSVAVTDGKKGQAQFSIEDEDKVLDLVAELVTGRINVYDDVETEIDLTN